MATATKGYFSPQVRVNVVEQELVEALAASRLGLSREGLHAQVTLGISGQFRGVLEQGGREVARSHSAEERACWLGLVESIEWRAFRERAELEREAERARAERFVAVGLVVC
jgi:hypothetical protein